MSGLRSVRSPARDTARRHSRHLFGFPQLDEACKGAMAHPIGPFEFLDPHNSLKNGLLLPALWGEFPFMGSLRVPCFLFRNQKEQRNPFWRGPVLKKEDTALPFHGHIGLVQALAHARVFWCGPCFKSIRAPKFPPYPFQ